LSNKGFGECSFEGQNAENGGPMQIYISREQQQIGPYTVAEARSRIIGGQLLGSDLAWHEGLAEWVTLSEILSRQLPPANAPRITPVAFSGYAVASFIASITGAVCWPILLIIAAMMSDKMQKDELVAGAIGFFMIAGLVVNILGTIAGILAVVNPCRNRWMGIVGIIFNVIEFLGVFTLLLIGIMSK
jgi:MFS family permease